MMEGSGHIAGLNLCRVEIARKWDEEDDETLKWSIGPSLRE